MPPYLGPDSEHIRRYLRVVLWRRRIEAARVRVDAVRREARLLVGFTVALAGFWVASALQGSLGFVRVVTLLGLSWLLWVEWRGWAARMKRARRRVSEAQAGLTAVRRERS